MVLTSFRSGLRDFFLQPSRELKHIARNPSRVGVGVLKGTLSLVSNSASGIFGFASNLGATIGETATLLTLDQHYQRLHSEQKVAQQRHYDRWKKKGFGHITLMVSRPVHDIVLGVLSASTGLVTEPYRGARKDGIPGVIKGTAIGVIGVVVKPIVGLSDAFAHVMESIDDIAKSMNLLELKFNPIERYRLPYVFGIKRMLLPFNEVDARSAQLLLAYPFEKKAKLSEETIVAAEALHIGNGIERYVVVSTMRVALFKLRVVDGQGFFTTTLVWQVWFGKGVRITCSVGNKGHNGCFLSITRCSSRSEDIPEELSEVKNEQREHQSDNSLADDESENPFPDTPKSFQPLGVVAPSFKLGNLWPLGVTEGYDVTRYVVEGEIKHRLQLSRIHNAICCICGDFDSIIYERNPVGGSEGVTSFGPLIFERELQTSAQYDSDLDLFYASLESTMWKFDEQESPYRSSDAFNKSLPLIPSWLVESRLRTMIAATPSLSLPPYLKSPEPEIQQNEFQMIKQEWEKNDLVTTELEDDLSLTNCFDEIRVPHGDSFGVECCSIETFDVSPLASHPSLTAPTADFGVSQSSTFPEQSVRFTPEVLEIKDAGNVTIDAVSDSGLDARLRRVEAMLERLLGDPSSAMSTPTLPNQMYDREALLTLQQQLSERKNADASTSRALNFD